MWSRLHTIMSTKSWLRCILLLCLMWFCGCHDESQSIANKCRIDGVVTINSNFYTGANGIKITLEGTSDNTIKHTVITDKNGKFNFRDIEAGSYFIDAQKEGYRWIWMNDDGFINHQNHLIQLSHNTVKSIEILMFSSDYGQEEVFDLDITDLEGKKINRIGISQGASTISFRVFNGTQKTHNWSLQYNLCYVTTGWEFEYVFNSFNYTSGTLKSGDNVVLVGYINPKIFSSQYYSIDGVLYFSDYGSGTNISKELKVYFD